MSTLFLFLVKILDMYSPGQCSASSIAPLLRKLFIPDLWPQISPQNNLISLVL